jgi:hypothetical protein
MATECTVRQKPTGNVVEPEALAEIMELLCRLHTCLLLAVLAFAPNLSRASGQIAEIGSVACKFFRADFIIIDSDFAQHLAQTFHNGWRTYDVINAARQLPVLRSPPNGLRASHLRGTPQALRFQYSGARKLVIAGMLS